MKNLWRIIIVLVLAASVTAVVVVKKKENSQTTINDSQTVIVQAQQLSEAKKLPRLVDLGADKCIPCKMMAPILEELKEDYAGVFTVEFIDVWKNPDVAEKYNIRIIPTQIFFDAAGKELFRHEGFFSEEDILAKWRELGVEFTKIK